MKFNMGCGARKLPGFVNVDAVAACSPDQVVDLEVTPWPWPDGCAEEIRFIHSLEHMGGDPKVFLAIMSEIYRIAADGCTVQINVPHYRHDHFVSDPTHVRAITPATLELFDMTANRRAAEMGLSNTPLGLYLGVDFETTAAKSIVEEPYWGQFNSGELSKADLLVKIATLANIVREYQISLKVRKPLRSANKDDVDLAQPAIA